jgi:hypothetical protein
LSRKQARDEFWCWSRYHSAYQNIQLRLGFMVLVPGTSVMSMVHHGHVLCAAVEL